MNRNPEVDAFIAAAPEAQRPVLKRLRALIRESLPQAEESLANGMPVYVVGGAKRWSAGFGSRKNSAMFYIMSSAHLDRYDKELGRCRTGKSCVAMVPTETLTMAQLEALAAQIVAELPASAESA